ncbi:hypothetical protein T265_01245 [Opisthorchis viverrini]|uniref:Uncharacterized protein n=1 Tax=Opisthorchis viverrini TaxID=6198 RepID=A0A075A096_OPIVI|nr:hypothetical protein T265_01245 [Opisthorchis viverrini]KER32761.1 hypothetical protein T265_01245 [Opisthorchis viverrini]
MRPYQSRLSSLTPLLHPFAMHCGSKTRFAGPILFFSAWSTVALRVPLKITNSSYKPFSNSPPTAISLISCWWVTSTPQRPPGLSSSASNQADVLQRCCERQPLTDKNKTDPGDLGKSLDPVCQSVSLVGERPVVVESKLLSGEAAGFVGLLSGASPRHSVSDFIQHTR